jgi:hypothetical protein
VVRDAFECQVSRSDSSGGDDPAKRCYTVKQRGRLHHQPDVRGLDNRCRQSEQLCICSVQMISQLGVPRRELGVTQGSSSLGHNAPLGPQSLQSHVNGAELTLQRSDLFGLDGGDASLEFVEARINGREYGRARRMQLCARCLGH